MLQQMRKIACDRADFLKYRRSDLDCWHHPDSSFLTPVAIGLLDLMGWLVGVAGGWWLGTAGGWGQTAYIPEAVYISCYPMFAGVNSTVSLPTAVHSGARKHIVLGISLVRYIRRLSPAVPPQPFHQPLSALASAHPL